MTKPLTLLIMAGGTGGHVFPGLAVAQVMRDRGWRVVWLGNKKGMEAKLVPKFDIPIQFIQFGGLRGKGMATKLALPFNLLRACIQSLRVLREVKPDVVLGMGGYIAFPAGLMAALLRLPLVLHEQNAVAGLTNRFLSKLATRVLVAFPNVLAKSLWTGNPIRTSLTSLAEPKARYIAKKGPLKILVLGGSLGATALNNIVPKALALLSKDQQLEVIHQAGEKHLQTLKENYAAANLSYCELIPSLAPSLVSFIDDMETAYSWADLIICRAGAMTVAEIAAVGVAALFIPFPHAVDDHQTKNAQFLVDKGAGFLMSQNELIPEKLALWLASLNRDALEKVATKARALAKLEAAKNVAQICAQLIFPVPLSTDEKI